MDQIFKKITLHLIQAKQKYNTMEISKKIDKKIAQMKKKAQKKNEEKKLDIIKEEEKVPTLYQEPLSPIITQKRKSSGKGEGVAKKRKRTFDDIYGSPIDFIDANIVDLQMVKDPKSENILIPAWDKFNFILPMMRITEHRVDQDGKRGHILLYSQDADLMKKFAELVDRVKEYFHKEEVPFEKVYNPMWKLETEDGEDLYFLKIYGSPHYWHVFDSATIHELESIDNLVPISKKSNATTFPKRKGNAVVKINKIWKGKNNGYGINIQLKALVLE